MDSRLLAELVFHNGTPLKPYVLDLMSTTHPKHEQELMFLFNGKIYKIFVKIEWVKNEKWGVGQGFFESKAVNLEKITEL